MFSGKTIIITGGSSGLGEKLAHRLVRRGARLALVARDPQKLETVRGVLRSEASPTPEIEAFPGDVAEAQGVRETFRRIAETLGPPDILINSAGILTEGYFEHQDLATFRGIMDTNFFGTLHCIQAALPYFKDKGAGRIINISSVAGRMGVFGYSAYCASKHAVAGLTAALRVELIHQNIRVHLVLPPEFDSPMVDAVNAYRGPENTAMAHTLPVLSADQVADDIIRGVLKNRYEIIPGRLTRIATGLERLFPGIGRSVVDYSMRRVYKGPDRRNS